MAFDYILIVICISGLSWYATAWHPDLHIRRCWGMPKNVGVMKHTYHHLIPSIFIDPFTEYYVTDCFLSTQKSSLPTKRHLFLLLKCLWYIIIERVWLVLEYGHHVWTIWLPLWCSSQVFHWQYICEMTVSNFRARGIHHSLFDLLHFLMR